MALLDDGGKKSAHYGHGKYAFVQVYHHNVEHKNRKSREGGRMSDTMMVKRGSWDFQYRNEGGRNCLI